eukprot:GFUD01009477.1.p1 GENE.GFUD01009477.1~~GFUD01009477.1.p1  ORF type:complete len:382 (+),score=87.60 GFUD01009477.1:57-1202(+)
MEEFAEHEILVGTYEEFVLGYKMVPHLKSSEGCDLVQSFTAKSHCGPVRSICTGSKYAISGGSDEICKIFDITKRAEHGTLMHHEGTVSCLATHSATSHLVTASDDNTITVVRMGSWQVEKTLYKHSAGVTALALHPTGKLAFSAGKDKKLITWNLVKARPAFITNIKGIAEFITVSPDGTRYAVGVHRRVDIYSIETAGVEYSIDIKARPNCLVFLNNDTVVVGGESSTAQMHSLIEKKMLRSWEVHTNRVRCMAMLGERMLVTASSSDNMIKIWNVSTDVTEEIACVASVDTTCRVTCLAIWHPGMRLGGKKRKKETAKEGSEVESPQKKVKLSEATEDKKVVETVTVEQEISTAGQKKIKKKKKPAKVPTDGPVEVAG